MKRSRSSVTAGDDALRQLAADVDPEARAMIAAGLKPPGPVARLARGLKLVGVVEIIGAGR